MTLSFQIFGHSVQITNNAELTALRQLQQTAVNIDMKVSEAIAIVQQTRDQVIKAKGEILGKIAKLENLDVELTPEQAAAISDLRAAVQGIDDVVPDSPTAPGAPIIVPDEPTIDLSSSSSESSSSSGSTSPEVPLTPGDDAAVQEEDTNS